MTSRLYGKNMAVVRDALCVLVFCVLAANALYFHISETETRCFIEEVPDETLIVGECVIGLVRIKYL